MPVDTLTPHAEAPAQADFQQGCLEVYQAHHTGCATPGCRCGNTPGLVLMVTVRPHGAPETAPPTDFPGAALSDWRSVGRFMEGLLQMAIQTFGSPPPDGLPRLIVATPQDLPAQLAEAILSTITAPDGPTRH